MESKKNMKWEIGMSLEFGGKDGSGKEKTEYKKKLRKQYCKVLEKEAC